MTISTILLSDSFLVVMLRMARVGVSLGGEGTLDLARSMTKSCWIRSEKM